MSGGPGGASARTRPGSCAPGSTGRPRTAGGVRAGPGKGGPNRGRRVATPPGGVAGVTGPPGGVPCPRHARQGDPSPHPSSLRRRSRRFLSGRRTWYSIARQPHVGQIGRSPPCARARGGPQFRRACGGLRDRRVRRESDDLLESGRNFSKPFGPITRNPPSLFSPNPSVASRARYSRSGSRSLGKPSIPETDGGAWPFPTHSFCQSRASARSPFSTPSPFSQSSTRTSATSFVSFQSPVSVRSSTAVTFPVMTWVDVVPRCSGVRGALSRLGGKSPALWR